ncbi:claudin-10-like [Xyrichtys novacula]|uniref:Claudin n=1 Tax=Xyrichtys novacula TaxID=13765 RepID=A0AAV1H0A6_XYRNO|nr:claudin-10-like [Xyrichtys novacula]
MRTMILEIFAFLLTTAGWMLICSTLPTEYWKIATLEGIVLGTALITSNLWKDCVGDSTGVSDCKEFPSMLSLDAHIQACRALMIIAVCLGFFGSAFALFGMKCTKIGGNDRRKSRTACFAGVTFIIGGLCSLTACSLYAHKITAEYFDPKFVEVNHRQADDTDKAVASNSPIFFNPSEQAKSESQWSRTDSSSSSTFKHFDTNSYV